MRTGNAAGLDRIPLTARPAMGADSSALRFLIAAGTVAIYIALGLALRLRTDEYLLMGIPILVVFQLGIHRQPIRAMWVRSAPPIRVDAVQIALWVLFAVAPAYDAVLAVRTRDTAHAVLSVVAIGGAFGAAYAITSFRRRTVLYLALCIATVLAIGLLPSIASALLPHLVHLHISARPSSAAGSGLAPAGLAAAGAFLFWPVGFVVEEAFFRGALDTYLHPPSRQGAGWISAIFVSALWGLWHLPGQMTQGLGSSHLLATALSLVAAQVLIGVPLSLWWRKSGNLLVTDVSHAVLEAARAIPALTT